MVCERRHPPIAYNASNDSRCPPQRLSDQPLPYQPSPHLYPSRHSPPQEPLAQLSVQCLTAPLTNPRHSLQYDAVGAAQFPRFIPDTMPQLRTQAAQMLSMFGSTYLCEQLFSSMKMTKTTHRRRLTDEHLRSILRISSAQSLIPDIDELASKKRCQVSDLGTFD